MQKSQLPDLKCFICFFPKPLSIHAWEISKHKPLLFMQKTYQKRHPKYIAERKRRAVHVKAFFLMILNCYPLFRRTGITTAQI